MSLAAVCEQNHAVGKPDCRTGSWTWPLACPPCARCETAALIVARYASGPDVGVQVALKGRMAGHLVALAHGHRCRPGRQLHRCGIAPTCSARKRRISSAMVPFSATLTLNRGCTSSAIVYPVGFDSSKLGAADKAARSSAPNAARLLKSRCCRTASNGVALRSEKKHLTQRMRRSG